MISSTFLNNESIAPQAQGGAINLSTNAFEFPNTYGSLSVTGSTFRGNVAYTNSNFGGFGGESAAGGAIWADPQVGVTVAASQFVDNEADAAVFTGTPGLAAGGAIQVDPGTFGFPPPPPSAVTITNSLFSGNTAVGTGTSGTQGQGGAINAGGFGGGAGGGTITISGSTFTGNQAMGDSSTINPSDGFPAAGRSHRHGPGCPCPHGRQLFRQQGGGRLRRRCTVRVRRCALQPALLLLHTESDSHDDDLQ